MCDYSAAACLRAAAAAGKENADGSPCQGYPFLGSYNAGCYTYTTGKYANCIYYGLVDGAEVVGEHQLGTLSATQERPAHYPDCSPPPSAMCGTGTTLTNGKCVQDRCGGGGVGVRALYPGQLWPDKEQFFTACVGDLTLPEAAARGCEVVTGSLSAGHSDSGDLVLPHLKLVGGDIQVRAPHAARPLPLHTLRRSLPAAPCL